MIHVDSHISIQICMYMYIHIYIHVYIHRRQQNGSGKMTVFKKFAALPQLFQEM